jgi:sirohydrochlorin ferrochelatase
MKRAVLIVDHGSRLPEANDLLDAVASRVRERLPDRLVRTAHLDLAAPSIPDAIDACAAEGAAEIVLAPWFLAPGAHTARDLQRIAQRAAQRHPTLRILCAAALGFDDVLLERLASAWPTGPGSAS